MIQFFITGTSSGIGKALTNEALSMGNRVDGMSRNRFIEHPAYVHHTLDLNDLKKVSKFRFKINPDAKKLVLINNSGALGDVKAVAQLNAGKVQRLYDLNLTAPSVLCAHFLEQTKGFAGERVIVNISSGAASYPVPSWSTYCASKAALSMFTEVMQLDHPGVHCMSIAPGIVDTAMQEEIRSSDERDFPDKERFVGYKENNQLSKPNEVAGKILHFVQHPEQKPSVCFSLRDV
jgi:benzil reductase ((S)-benzoin forming)